MALSSPALRMAPCSVSSKSGSQQGCSSRVLMELKEEAARNHAQAIQACGQAAHGASCEYSCASTTAEAEAAGEAEELVEAGAAGG
eukprot:1158263-Pelagomonas_calceolata.AAC.5